MPGVVSVPLGKKEDVPGQKNAKRSNDALVLVGDVYDAQTGVIARQSTRVKIYKSRRSKDK
jgi:hypothetical protein